MSLWRNGTEESRSIHSTRSTLRKRAGALRSACEALEPRRLFATVSWVTIGDGNWATGSNWDAGHAPNPGDDVRIDIPGRNITVTYDSAAVLPLNNLLNNELLIIDNAAGATWTSGTWDGAGIVEVNTNLAISGSANKILKDGQTILNNGTTTLTGTGNIVGQVGATITNFGTFDVQSDADITFPSGVGDGNFNNGGLFMKSGGAGTTEIGGEQGFTYNNSFNVAIPIPGITQIQVGTLALGDNQNTALSQADNVFDISAGATLDFIRGVHNIVYFTNPSDGKDYVPTITGAGRLRISGGDVQHYGFFTVHQIDMDAGRFLLQQNMTKTGGLPQRNNTNTTNLTPIVDSGTTDILNLSGGTLGGNGAGLYGTPIRELPALIVADQFHWTGGSLSGAGRLVIDQTVTDATITTPAAKSISGGFGLDFLGNVIWQDSGTITITGDSAIWIHPAGSLWDQNDGSITGVLGGTGNVWNSGNFLKQNGTGTTTIGNGVTFVNNSGFGGGAGIPHLLYAEGNSPLVARLDIRTGTILLSGNSTNSNVYLIKPGATLTFSGGTHINGTADNADVTAKILGVDGGGTLNFGDGITFTGDGEALVDVGQTNFGTGAHQFNNTADGGQVIHTGTFTGGTTGTISGLGTLKVLDNLTWNSGTFTSTGATSSLLLIDTGATLTIPSGDRSTIGSYSIENRGTIEWTTSPGLLTIAGDYTQTSTGTFIADIVSGPTGMNRLQVGGNVAVAGILSLNLGAFSPTVGDQYFVIDNTGDNPIAGTFAGLNEGDTITIGTTVFSVSYVGGDGNDLVLTASAIPIITIAAPVPVTEGNTGTTNMDFTVSLSQAVTQNVSVNFATSSGTATSGSDFTATSGTLTILAGALTGTISVPVIGDTADESNETFTVTLSSPVNGNLGTPASATGTILDDDGPPLIKVEPATYTVAENAGVASIIVTRTNPSIAFTVDYATSSGSAAAGLDFTAVSGTLSFGIGVSSLTIDVPIIDDTLYEGSAISNGDETFNVVLSHPVGGGATIGVSTGVVTITDNDLPGLSVSDPSVIEGNTGTTSLIYTVTLQPSINPVTVDFATADGTALAGLDYLSNTGTLSFAPGETAQTVTVTVIGELVVEGDETALLNLTNPVAASISKAQGVGTILTDDFPAISISDATITEGINQEVDAVFTISVNTAVSSPLTVQYTTVDGSATAGSDYLAKTGTFTLQPNQSSALLHIPIISDFADELTENFTIVLSSPTGGAVLGTATGTGTILNQPVLTATFDAKHPYRYTDFIGNRVAVILKGPGSGVVTYLGGSGYDIKAITLNDTTVKSQLFVKTSKLQTSLVDMTVNGSINLIDAPKLNLLGNLNVAGALQKLRLNFLSNGNALNIGPGDGTIKGLSATFNRVIDVTLTSALPLTLLKVTNWQDSDTTPDIIAPAATTIISLADFQADVTLTGNLGTLKVSKQLANADIRVGGTVKLIQAGTIAGSKLFAGVLDTVTTLPNSAAEFANTTSILRAVTVVSKAVGAFSNTLIAAPFVGKVQLGSVAASNSDVIFGVAGTSLTSAKGKTAAKFNLTNAGLTGNPFSDDDLLIHLVAPVV